MTERSNEVGIQQVLACLRVSNANAAIHFYVEAFGASEEFRLVEPNDRVCHAMLKLGAHNIVVSDEYPENGSVSPTALDGTCVGIYLRMDDVDAAFESALAAGASAIAEPADQFFGERTGRIRDPFGHEWILSQQLEKLSPVEMQERLDAQFSESVG